MCVCARVWIQLGLSRVLYNLLNVLLFFLLFSSVHRIDPSDNNQSIFGHFTGSKSTLTMVPIGFTMATNTTNLNKYLIFNIYISLFSSIPFLFLLWFYSNFLLLFFIIFIFDYLIKYQLNRMYVHTVLFIITTTAATTTTNTIKQKVFETEFYKEEFRRR